MKYKIKITAGNKALFVTNGLDNTSFSENEADAAVFTDSFSDLDRYVLSEIKHAPFIAGVVEDDEEGQTYEDVGLQKIEFIYQTG